MRVGHVNPWRNYSNKATYCHHLIRRSFAGQSMEFASRAICLNRRSGKCLIVCEPAVLYKERSITLLGKRTVDINLGLCPSWGLREGRISKYGQTVNAVPKCGPCNIPPSTPISTIMPTSFLLSWWLPSGTYQDEHSTNHYQKNGKQYYRGCTAGWKALEGVGTSWFLLSS